MLAMFFLVLGGFAGLMVLSCRKGLKAERAGQAFQPEGKLRW